MPERHGTRLSHQGHAPRDCRAPRTARGAEARQTELSRAGRSFTASEKIPRARPALRKNMMRRGKRRSATSRSGKRPGRRIILRDSRKFAALAPSRSVGATRIRRCPPPLQRPRPQNSTTFPVFVHRGYRNASDAHHAPFRMLFPALLCPRPDMHFPADMPDAVHPRCRRNAPQTPFSRCKQRSRSRPQAKGKARDGGAASSGLRRARRKAGRRGGPLSPGRECRGGRRNRESGAEPGCASDGGAGRTRNQRSDGREQGPGKGG